MIYINQSDFQKLISPEGLMDRIEKAFAIQRSKDYYMPNRIHLHRGQNTVLYMPCFTEDIFGTKIVTVFPDNYHYKMPAVQGLMLLNDINTGKPLAIIDGANLTAYRTGAVGGLGIKYMSKPDCQYVGLVGTGIQGFYQLLFAAKVRKLVRICVFDTDTDKAQIFKQKISEQLPGVEIDIASNAVELVSKSEIIITATNSHQPVLPNDQNLLRGKHIIAIGSYKPDMRELPAALFGLLSNIYVDTKFAIEESGDLVVPLQKGWIELAQIDSFANLLLDNPRKYTKGQQTTLFKSVGMALFDLVVAETVYLRAVQESVGQQLS